jgi:hypothetical protein
MESDATDFRLLQALDACATASAEPADRISRDAQVLRSYLKTGINLGKAAEELGLSRLELQARFLRRLGSNESGSRRLRGRKAEVRT